jgi:sulfate-transporting ATPase
MAHEYVLTMQDVRKVVHPKREILKGMTLAFLPGAKIGVLGNNGSGKSTLLRIMAGVDTEHFGDVRRAKGVRIGYLPQEPSLDETLDVRGNVDLGVAGVKSLLARFEALSERLGESMPEKEYDKVMTEFTSVQEQIDALDGWSLDRQVEVAMDALRLPPAEAAVATLSGGERRRVALCRLLLEKPDMLLLDEPTNHLDAESVAWLEQHLHAFPGTVIAVTHDRYFLDNVAGWILELDRGEGYPFKGNYTSWLEQKRARLEVEEKVESARRKTLARELEWVRMAPRARQAKSKARLAAYEQLAAEAGQEKAVQAELQIPPGPRLGDLVIEADGIARRYGERVLFEGLSFKLPRGGIVGIIGPNGTGKSSLFRILAGLDAPDGGTLRVGESVVLSYVDQSRARPRPQQDRLGGNLRGQGGDHPRQTHPPDARVRVGLRLPRQRPAEARGRAVGRRAQPRTPRQAPEARRQRAAPRRAHQRPRRRHPARPRRRPARLRRLRPGHLPRPVVSRPRGDAHAGLRGRQPRGVV